MSSEWLRHSCDSEIACLTWFPHSQILRNWLLLVHQWLGLKKKKKLHILKLSFSSSSFLWQFYCFFTFFMPWIKGSIMWKCSNILKDFLKVFRYLPSKLWSGRIKWIMKHYCIGVIKWKISHKQYTLKHL